MDRESQEFYQSGEEVEIGVYRSLSTGQFVRIRQTGGTLPEAEGGRRDTYEWISGNPDWDFEESDLTEPREEVKPMVVAEVSITPLVEGELKPYIDAAVEEIKKSGVKYEVDALGTTLEGDLDTVLEVAKHAHEAVRRKGAERVMTEIRIDEKAGGATINEELEGYR
ncbi:MAG: MTH1187 family thiamine-binding protein [Armatimonadota bacterium]|nr:MTH1187 family thiamine-binding protein [Armatimonadota bacterium]